MTHDDCDEIKASEIRDGDDVTVTLRGIARPECGGGFYLREGLAETDLIRSVRGCDKDMRHALRFRVGERVVFDGCPSVDAFVLAIDGHTFWIRYGAGFHSTVSADNLRKPQAPAD